MKVLMSGLHVSVERLLADDERIDTVIGILVAKARAIAEEARRGERDAEDR